MSVNVRTSWHKSCWLYYNIWLQGLLTFADVHSLTLNCSKLYCLTEEWGDRDDMASWSTKPYVDQRGLNPERIILTSLRYIPRNLPKAERLWISYVCKHACGTYTEESFKKMVGRKFFFHRSKFRRFITWMWKIVNSEIFKSQITLKFSRCFRCSNSNSKIYNSIIICENIR